MRDTLHGAPGSANVLDFGADPTGVADSAPAIQAAIVAAGRSVGSSCTGTVYVPKGSYKIGSSLVLSRYETRFLGEGRDASVLRADPGVTLFTVSAANTAGINVHWESIQLEGQPAPQEYAFTAPTPTGAISLTYEIHRSRLKNFRGVYDLAGKAVETSGSRFCDVEFDNAPLNMTSAAQNNACTFVQCRWSGTTQDQPATLIASETAIVSGVTFLGCRWEGNQHSAVKLSRVFYPLFDGCYWEANATGYDVPVVDLYDIVNTVCFGTNYAAEAAPRRFIDSSKAGGTTVYSVLFRQMAVSGGATINYAMMPDFVALTTPGGSPSWGARAVFMPGINAPVAGLSVCAVDPAAVAGQCQLYAKADGLYARLADGTVKKVVLS